jgi:hypothetical protein
MVLFAACSPSKFPESLLTQEERAIVRGAVNDVSNGEYARLATKVEPEIAAQLGNAAPAMQRALPARPLELSALNANVSVSGDTRVANAVYQAKGGTGWALIEATTQTRAGQTRLAGLYVQKVESEPRHLNEFRLMNAGVAAWAMLGGMIAAVAITIAALVRIWRSGLFGRRWLWTIGTLIGVTTLKMDWSTGEFAFQPVAFQIFSASALKQPVYAPWILGVSLPLVALIALIRREGRREDVSAEA